MPTLQDKLPDNPSKSLARKTDRSRRVAQLEKVAMPMQCLIQLRSLQFGLFKRFNELRRGVPVVVGKGENKHVVEVVPDDALCQIVGAYVKVAEMRRTLLRLPGPGRESSRERDQNLKTIDVNAADVVDAQTIEQFKAIVDRGETDLPEPIPPLEAA